MHAFGARAAGMRAAVRLNGSSDIVWEKHGVPQRHPTVQFYDYTRAPYQARASRPFNYHLTFSLDERPESMARALVWLENGGLVAVVVAGENHKPSVAKNVARQLVDLGWRGFDAVDGDASDVRFNDPGGSWVVLYAKGHKALRDVSGFVHRFTTSTTMQLA